MKTESQNIGEKLQALPKWVLFLTLIFCATVPLFFNVQLPNQPVDSSIDFYVQLAQLKPGDKVLLASDWTLSTRGESGGQMVAVVKMLIRRGVKFVVYSTADTQAPQVARMAIEKIAKDEHEHGQPLYRPYEDYVVCGYFPNSEGTHTAINNNVLEAFKGKKDNTPSGHAEDVLSSPVFQGVHSASDFKFLVMITASGTEKIALERIKKVPLLYAVTGVMVPEDLVYYASGQLKGLCGGVKGVYDLETMMDSGVNYSADGVSSSKYDKIPPFTGGINKGQGTAYFASLHLCLALLILAVAAGNIGMALARRSKAR